MTVLKIFLLLSLLCSTHCTVYKSEGKKSFESASNDYGSRSSSSSLENCQAMTPQSLQQLLDNPTRPSHVEILFSEEDQQYYECPANLTQLDSTEVENTK
jgi:hypothetical protein